MNYSVIWLARSKIDMTSEWLRTARKEAMSGYVHQIERILGRNPKDQGESREGNVRIWFHRPLCIYYLVDESKKVVYIGRIRWVGL